MDAVQLNWLAIAVAAVVVYVGGALWYSLLFAKTWMGLSGVTDQRMAEGVTSPAVALAGEAVRTLITVTVLAVVVSWSGAGDAASGALVGAILCVGFVIGETSKLVLFEHRSFQLFLLNNAYNLLSLIVAGAILAVWQ